MSTIIVEQRTPTAATRPFRGRARWAAAALLVTGAGLQVAEFLFENPIDDTPARVAYWQQHVTQIGLSEAVGLLAVPFLLGALAVQVALVRAASRRLAWVAASAMVCALVGLAAVHGAELMAYGLVRSGNPTAAVSALEGADLGAPGIVLFALFLGGAAIGVLAMSVALWRSPLVPRLAPVLVIAFGVLDFVVGSPVVSHVVALAGGAVLAWAVLTGYSRKVQIAGDRRRMTTR